MKIRELNQEESEELNTLLEALAIAGEIDTSIPKSGAIDLDKLNKEDPERYNQIMAIKAKLEEKKNEK